MVQYDTFRSLRDQPSPMRKWLWRALALSLVVHLGLVVFFKVKNLEDFTLTASDPVASLRFVVNNVRIDPKLLLPPDEKRLSVPVKIPNQKIAIPQDKPQPREVIIKPQATEVGSPLLLDKPKGSPLNWEALNKSQTESAGRADRELGSISTALLERSVKQPNQPAITMPPGKRNGEGIGGDDGIPGRRSIDDALAQAGSPTGNNEPVAMPGGALFEHDHAELRGEAIDALQKLGQLFLSYPDATFTISGHTDWTGSADYNQRLSERRAEAVKEWLVNNMHIAPERIQTIGRGSADAIVPAERTVDEQQPNRRVEIIVKTRK